MRHLLAVVAIAFTAAATAHAEDGYDLWLRYPAIEDANLASVSRRGDGDRRAGQTEPRC